MLAKLCDRLLDNLSPVPYTIGSISGIVLLNHPPDFSENEKRFLKALSSRRPLHHVCVQGSFRLGFHGAYIDDEIKPIETEEELPSWIPAHAVQQPEPKPEDYATERVHIISFDRATQVMDAAISAFQHYRSSGGKSVLLIDANKDRHSEWNRRFNQIGITCDTQAEVVGSTSAVQAILRFLSVSHGQDAWSIVKLFDIVQSQAFPILENLFSGLEHPANKDWRPRPHLDVLENIGLSLIHI